MTEKMNRLLLVFLVSLVVFAAKCQSIDRPFRIRTITAGITVNSLEDTVSINRAVGFLKEARRRFREAGYEVQTIRIATQNLYEYLDGLTHDEALPYLMKFDQMARRDTIAFSIGAVLPPDVYDAQMGEWASTLINKTRMISLSVPISSSALHIHSNSIRAATEIILAVSKSSPGGEGNFRFTASANCPAGIPFFPAAYHRGEMSFGIGLESPNLLKSVFSRSDWDDVKDNLRSELERQFRPIEDLAMRLSESTGWGYDGIDTSPAPGLDASIGEAVETLTGHAFGGPSTLRACALITDVIKSLPLKTCGYSGLMLPVLEDKVLAQRAMENRFTVQELLLFSSVSGTGLDVIPLPGATPAEAIQRILYDVASLSLKYTNKALSARLLPIPGKHAGDRVEFDNPHLTPALIMKIE